MRRGRREWGRFRRAAVAARPRPLRPKKRVWGKATAGRTGAARLPRRGARQARKTPGLGPVQVLPRRVQAKGRADCNRLATF